MSLSLSQAATVEQLILARARLRAVLSHVRGAGQIHPRAEGLAQCLLEDAQVLAETLRKMLAGAPR